MKKYLFILLSVVVGLMSQSKGIIEKVDTHYYDKKAEAILKPLRNCSYVVDFEFYGRPVRVVGYKEPLRRKLPSTLPKIVMKRIVYTEQDRIDGYHKEEHYKYFLVQVPSKGYMKLNYTFTDRMGDVILKSEKIFEPRYRQIFPSNKIIPKKCFGRINGLR